jgi:DNA-binding GntR family transcriptional regulator
LVWRKERADIVDLDRRIDAMRRAARNDDVEEILRADIAFHTEIREAAENPLCLALWKAIAQRVLIVRSSSTAGDFTTSTSTPW